MPPSPRNQTIEAQVGTQLTLSNGAELVSSAIEKMAGEQISNHLAGEAMYGNPLADIVATKLQARLASIINN